jgi:hypothetical protein
VERAAHLSFAHNLAGGEPAGFDDGEAGAGERLRTILARCGKQRCILAVATWRQGGAQRRLSSLQRLAAMSHVAATTAQCEFADAAAGSADAGATLGSSKEAKASLPRSRLEEALAQVHSLMESLRVQRECKAADQGARCREFSFKSLLHAPLALPTQPAPRKLRAPLQAPDHSPLNEFPRAPQTAAARTGPLASPPSPAQLDELYQSEATELLRPLLFEHAEDGDAEMRRLLCSGERPQYLVRLVFLCVGILLGWESLAWERVPEFVWPPRSASAAAHRASRHSARRAVDDGFSAVTPSVTEDTPFFKRLSHFAVSELTSAQRRAVRQALSEPALSTEHVGDVSLVAERLLRWVQLTVHFGRGDRARHGRRKFNFESTAHSM